MYNSELPIMLIIIFAHQDSSHYITNNCMIHADQKSTTLLQLNLNEQKLFRALKNRRQCNTHRNDELYSSSDSLQMWILKNYKDLLQNVQHNICNVKVILKLTIENDVQQPPTPYPKLNYIIRYIVSQNRAFSKNMKFDKWTNLS